jgi:hypothetical protein
MNSPILAINAVDDLIQSIALGDHILTPDLREETFNLFTQLSFGKFETLVLQIGLQRAQMEFTLTKSCFEQKNYKNVLLNETHMLALWNDYLKQHFDKDGNNEIDAYEFTCLFIKLAISARDYETKSHHSIRNSKDFVESIKRFRRAFEINYREVLDRFRERCQQIVEGHP